MNIAVEIKSQYESNPIAAALKQVIGAVGSCKFTAPSDADIVIANNPEELLRFLKQGKRVFQFITSRETPATGLLTAPAFANRFKIFVAVEGMCQFEYPGFPAMLAEIETIRKEIEGENSRS